MELKFSELVERLIIANIKLTIADHQKFYEIQKEQPDAEKVLDWERTARNANELRAQARNAIDKLLMEILEHGEYKPLVEERTFK